MPEGVSSAELGSRIAAAVEAAIGAVVAEHERGLVAEAQALSGPAGREYVERSLQLWREAEAVSARMLEVYWKPAHIGRLVGFSGDTRRSATAAGLTTTLPELPAAKELRAAIVERVARAWDAGRRVNVVELGLAQRALLNTRQGATLRLEVDGRPCALLVRGVEGDTVSVYHDPVAPPAL